MKKLIGVLFFSLCSLSFVTSLNAMILLESYTGIITEKKPQNRIIEIPVTQALTNLTRRRMPCCHTKRRG